VCLRRRLIEELEFGFDFDRFLLCLKLKFEMQIY